MSTALFSFRINPYFVIFIQVLVSFSFAVILLFPNFSAQWYLIDDHEIMDFMGKDHRLSFNEIPEILMRTEVGLHKENGRYRPSYYLLRLLETALWGDNPHLWYSFRIVLFGASIFIAWHILSHFFGIIVGGLSCLTMLSHPFWSEIWSRLGPAETYCVFGLSLYCLAFSKLWVQKKSRNANLWWGLLALGAVISMGSKENFLLLLPSSAILVYHVWKKARIGMIPIIINLILFLFGMFIVGALIFILMNKGVDVYLRPVDPLSRIRILQSGLGYWIIQLPFWLSLFLFIVARLFHQQHKLSAEVLRELKRLLIIQTCLLFIWYSQFVFYNGSWPCGSRYDFPGLLAQDLAYIFLIFSPITVMRTFSSNSYFQYAKNLAHILIILLLTFQIIHSGINNYKMIYGNCAANRIKSQDFTKILAGIIRQAKENPKVPLIIMSHNVWDYESIVSLRRFFAFHDIKNPISLKIEGWSKLTCKNDLERLLCERLNNLSEGKDIPGQTNITQQPRFYPLHSLPQADNMCFAIDMSGNSTSPCTNLGRIL